MDSGPPAENDTSWEYMALAPRAAKYIVMTPLTRGSSETIAPASTQQQLYECVVDRRLPGLVLELQVDAEATTAEMFHTKDVFVRHERDANRWKFVGRLDDYFSLASARVINANTYEEVVKSRCGDLVDECVLFGEGRSKLGMLIWLKNCPAGSDVGKQTASDHNVAEVFAEKVREKVWEELSEWVAAIGDVITNDADWRTDVIEKNLVVVVGPGGAAAHAEVPRTDKGNVMRYQAYSRFAGLIEDAYKTSDT